MNIASHPILSCSESADWEGAILLDAESEWLAMKRVGVLLARGIRSEFSVTRFSQRDLRVLVLVGKGHNGGDALLCLGELAKEDGFLGTVSLVFLSPVSELRDNTRRAYEQLEKLLDLRVMSAADFLEAHWESGFDICIDGLLGMQFRAPLRDNARALLRAVNQMSGIRLRVAVDLPSGVGETSDEDAFRADVSFATGIWKRPLLDCKFSGNTRYLDIGFFESDVAAAERVITDRILDPLRGLRPARSEKRRFGHLAIVAGSRGMPGALAMCVRSALQSGVGLVTVFAPESVVAQLACSLPEAMWKTWPETPEGGLALEGLWQVKSLMGKASCLLTGPGMGAEKETRALLCEIGKVWDKPAVLDADALRPEVVAAFCDAGNCDLALTPHDGEFKRLTACDDCSDTAVREYARANGVCLVKKGSATRVSDGETVFVNPTGNAVLSRGGSGDLLAGLIAGLLAQGGEALEAACCGVYWHGRAADLLAESKGQVAVRTTDLLDFLAPALQVRDA